MYVQQTVEPNIQASYRVPAKPLDFSFTNLTDIQALRKEVARGGNRKPIPESDDEEENKKVSYNFFPDQ